MRIRQYILTSLIALMAILCLPSTIAAQAQQFVMDSTRVIADPKISLESLRVQEFLDSLDVQATPTPSEGLTTAPPSPTRRQLRQQRLATFIPDPSKATWSAIVFPGGGQIYNHKYWKLPIVYGGFLGCAYALNWNNQMYSDYSQAYLDIMDDDPNTASYEDFLPPRYNIEANKDYLKRVFKNRKDTYRRQRDLSIFCFIGVYLISIVDAYVDAELSNFDITDDLSVQVRPTTIDNRQSTLRNQAYGLQCSFSF